jgi:hypothetical protein
MRRPPTSRTAGAVLARVARPEARDSPASVFFAGAVRREPLAPSLGLALRREDFRGAACAFDFIRYIEIMGARGRAYARERVRMRAGARN